jgi:uncharacterized protein (DUF1810 family)
MQVAPEADRSAEPRRLARVLESMEASFDLDRFVEAQAPVFDQIRRELQAGRKRSHWMWFVFPQLRGLGRSATALHYGLQGAAEARAYLGHRVLGPRLVECTELVNQVQDKTAQEIFGSPDDLKFRSCVTLFSKLRSAPFEDALRRYYGGQPDPLTLELLDAA